MRRGTSLRAALIGLALIAIASCATIGAPTPQTFNERLAAGIATTTAVRQTATALLRDGTIAADDAMNAQAAADASRAGLDVARRLHATDPVAGDARLTAAITGLQAIQSYLASRKKR